MGGPDGPTDIRALIVPHRRAQLSTLHLSDHRSTSPAVTMSVKPEYVVPAVVGTCAAAVGAAIGYMYGSRIKKGVFNKSYLTSNPLVKYAAERSMRLTPVQKRQNEVTLKHSWARMMGSPDELQFLANICRAMGVKKAIDIGVFTGCSAMAIALALPESGKVVACDVSREYTDIGKPFWAEAGVDKKIDLRIAPAATTLRQLLENGEEGTFDFAFVDADKTGYDTYYELCLKLLRPGGLIAFDNMVQSGEVINPKCTHESVVALRKLNDKIAADDRVNCTLLLIGDGTMMCFKN